MITQKNGPQSNNWHYAGPASSFPNINPAKISSSTKLSDVVTCSSNDSDTQSPVCKIVQTSTQPSQILTQSEALDMVGIEEQVMIFQYRGKYHAVDHTCPHRSFPLSRGSLYDIEDFGIMLSAGITCPKHGWAFDLFTGESDRGAYRLNIWEVELRPSDSDQSINEIWVRKRPRPRIG